MHAAQSQPLKDQDPLNIILTCMDLGPMGVSNNISTITTSLIDCTPVLLTVGDISDMRLILQASGSIAHLNWT